MGDIADWHVEQMDIPDENDDLNASCKYCGESYLYWSETDSGWRLHDHYGKLHSCKKRNK